MEVADGCPAGAVELELEAGEGLEEDVAESVGGAENGLEGLGSTELMLEPGSGATVEGLRSATGFAPVAPPVPAPPPQALKKHANTTTPAVSTRETTLDFITR